MNMISKELLEILVCPVDKKPLQLIENKWLKCTQCKRKYEIIDDIPNMLPEEAVMDKE